MSFYEMTKVSEGMERVYTTRMENHYADATYCLTRIRGRVNVEASWQHGVLYVQLIRVAELVAHSSDQQYEIRAKISIEHTCTCKSELRCNCQVETVKCSRFPVFNSKVSFEVQALDCDMRLMVTILICDSTTGRQTIVGRASFSMRSIVVENKTISGWYRLFKEEDFCRVKHEMSTSEILKWELAAKSENQFWSNPKCFISRVFFMPPLEVLNKVQFHSCRPPTVSEVVGASLLQRGDVIFSLNDLDVSSYRGSTIHHIIKSLNAIFKVEVLREVPNCSARQELCQQDKGEAYRRKREHTEYDFCNIDQQRGKGEVDRKKRENAENTVVVCLKMQEIKEEIIHEDIIECDPDATKTVECAVVSRGCRPKPSMLKNITKCMGNNVTINSCAKNEIYNRR